MTLKAINNSNFGDIALRHLDALWQTANWITNNEGDAENLVMSTYIEASRIRDGSISAIDCKIQMFKILMKIILGKFKLDFQTHLPDDFEDIYEFIPSKPISAIEGIPGNVISRAINRLPLENRLMIVLSILAKFSYQEIAGLLGVSRRTVSLRVYQGYLLIHREIFNPLATGSKT